MNSQLFQHEHRPVEPVCRRSAPRPAPGRQVRAAQRGFSLVELMVALVLSVVVVAGVLQVYTTSSRDYRIQEASAQMMENGRIAIEILSRDLRLANYWKCVGWQAANLSFHVPSDQRGLYGTNDASGAPDSLRTLHALDETAVTVQAEVELTGLDTSTVPATVTPNPIPVSDTSNFGGNELIVINDCAKGDVFQITGVNANSLTHNCTTCVETYGIGSTVLQVEDTQYFIADNDRSQPALFRIVNGGAAEELIEGVEDMQVFFGEDTDSDGFANRFVTADVINAPCAGGTDPGCWRRVTSTRISLVVRTLEDNLTQAPQVYNFNGATVTAGDRRLRRVFTTVVALRNQLS